MGGKLNTPNERKCWSPLYSLEVELVVGLCLLWPAALKKNKQSSS